MINTKNVERREELWLINDFALFYDKSDDDDIGQEFIHYLQIHGILEVMNEN